MQSRLLDFRYSAVQFSAGQSERGLLRPQEASLMILKPIVSFAFAAACLTAIAMTPVPAQTAGSYGSTAGDPGPQSDPPQAGTSGMAQSASARQNVIQSRSYDHSLETNRKFRQARMRKECGPIS